MSKKHEYVEIAADNDSDTFAGQTHIPCAPAISGAAPLRLVVGIGASAGGLEAFKTFFAGMRADTGMAFVLVQHLAPNADSVLASLVAGYTAMPVLVAIDGALVEANTVYVIPPDAILTIAAGRLQVASPAATPARRISVTTFLTSLAIDQGQNAVGIILSGFGSDGMDGIAAIKEHGGLTLSQAEFDHHAKSGMPQSSTATGFVDHVLPVEEMPAALLNYQHHRTIFDASIDDQGIRRDLPSYMPTICAALNTRTGRDFSLYKSGTLMRRIQRRMHVLQLEEVPAYIDKLRSLPHEADVLFRELLVSVTKFFRDPEAFSALADTVLAPLFDEPNSTEPLRIWVTACATGEEAYSIAILLLELMDSTGHYRPIQIFATDIDDRAISVARAGRYRSEIAEMMSPERLDRYFTKEHDGYHVTKAVREICLFSVHNLIKDPPFSRLHLITCRNLLIYLQPTLQEHVFAIFHYALRPDGDLMLGQSENMPAQSRLFAALDKRNRIYVRRNAAARFPAFLLAPSQLPTHAPPVRKSAVVASDVIERKAAQLVAQFSPAFVILDQYDDVIRFSGYTAKYIEPMSGVATLNLFALLHSDLRATARAHIAKVRRTGTATSCERVGMQHGELTSSVNLVVEPLSDPKQTGLLVLAFQDVVATSPVLPPPAAPALAANHPSGAEFEKLLLMAQERLRAVSEELEAANEELQSSNQEYLAMNEELQSANEELESSKEELQSLNDSLQTSNAALNLRNDSLVRSSGDLSNLFDSTSIATLFLDSDLNIRRFTPQLLEIFNLRAGDEGRPISDIVTRLTLSSLPEDVQQVLSSRKSVEREVMAMSGVTYLMQIRPYRELNNSVNGAVLTFVDISERKQHEHARSRLAAIVESSQDGIISHDLNGVITSWNAGAALLFGFTAAEAVGQVMSSLLHDPQLEHWPNLGATAVEKQPVERFETALMTKAGSPLDVSITISPVREGDGRIVGASVVARDISERKATDRKAELLLGELDHRVKNILAVVSAVVSQTLSSGLTPEAFAMEVEGRIRAVAKAHSLLTHAGHGTLSLRDVIDTELAPYDRNPGHIVVRGPDVDMTPKAGLALAMAIHELTSNAAKYGALSTQQGRLAVISSLASGPEGMMLSLDWTEANGPPVVLPTRRGFGTSLIERALAYELDATVTRSFEESGVVCQFVIPLTEEVGHIQPCPVT